MFVNKKYRCSEGSVKSRLLFLEWNLLLAGVAKIEANDLFLKLPYYPSHLRLQIDIHHEERDLHRVSVHHPCTCVADHNGRCAWLPPNFLVCPRRKLIKKQFSKRGLRGGFGIPTKMKWHGCIGSQVLSHCAAVMHQTNFPHDKIRQKKCQP